MSAKETAEAFLLVIKRIAKWAGVGALILGALGLAIWGAVWVYQYFDYERPKANVEVVVLKDKCGDDYPFFVGVVNKSRKTILRYSFKFEVTQQGRSTNLASYKTNSDDKILKPGDGWGSCWRIEHTDSRYDKTVWITDTSLEVGVVDFRPVFE